MVYLDDERYHMITRKKNNAETLWWENRLQLLSRPRNRPKCVIYVISVQHLPYIRATFIPIRAPRHVRTYDVDALIPFVRAASYEEILRFHVPIDQVFRMHELYPM